MSWTDILTGRVERMLKDAGKEANVRPVGYGINMRGHELNIEYGYNVRELSGYKTPHGPTLPGRYLRCGSTQSLSRTGINQLLDYGVRYDLDLRGPTESPRTTDMLAHIPEIEWRNISLLEYDMTAEAMDPVGGFRSYLVGGYLSMLARKESIAQIFEFLALPSLDECLLFHCAAGMDRTGMLSMLVLGAAGVSREDITLDYCYSFDGQHEVETAVAAANTEDWHNVSYDLKTRIQAIGCVYDTIVHNHGSIEGFLLNCGVTQAQIEAVVKHLTHV